MGNAEMKNSTSLFNNQFAKASSTLLQLCQFAIRKKNEDIFPCRNFLRLLYSETARIEELLDQYGARKNSDWFQFRELIAAQKMLSNMCYNVKHIQRAAPAYKLLSIEDDFPGDTEHSLSNLKSFIVTVSKKILENTLEKGIPLPDDTIDLDSREDELPEQLESSKKLKVIKDPQKSMIYLANKVLNYADDIEVLDILKERKNENFESCIPFNVSEEKIRIVEARFHNLQAMYDTYISETDLEQRDKSLPILRGHMSMIFHLLESATSLSHFYERHIMNPYQGTGFPFSNNLVLKMLFSYFLHYAYLYLSSTRELTRSIIKEYSETREITVKTPKYRGFHVRPSTLIAKIAIHYGSPLVMKLDNKEYDASQPLELFRANEEINAYKRILLGKKVELLKNFEEKLSNGKTCCILTRYLYDMAIEKSIVLYDYTVDCSELDYDKEASTGAALLAIIKHYLATGKLDINADIEVNFTGDSRAIDDVECLARHGYGEDVFGNNTMLPPELGYLR